MLCHGPVLTLSYFCKISAAMHNLLIERFITSEKLLTLPHTYEVNSGHGPSTTLGEETLNNPYL